MPILGGVAWAYGRVTCQRLSATETVVCRRDEAHVRWRRGKVPQIFLERRQA